MNYEEHKLSTVPIKQITKDTTLQVRTKLDHIVIKRYADAYEAGAAMPPVRLAAYDGILVVIDGWHRLAALESLGYAEVDAEVQKMSRRDAIWQSARANLTHGLPLKNKEHRAVFRAYISSRQHLKKGSAIKSYRDIGRELGKNHGTVRNWMIKDFPDVAMRMGGIESFVGVGGLTEVPSGPPGVAQQVLQSLSEAQDLFLTMTDPNERGTIVEKAEKMLCDMKASGAWVLPEYDF